MRYFPVFLDLRDKPVLVVGGGEEALRKVRLLLKTEAHIHVVAGSLHAELAAEPRMRWIAKAYHAGLVEGAALVCVADAALNERVAADAQAAGIPVNVVDHPDLSSFIVPSIVDRDPLVVAIGTEGTAPILGQGLRARIDAMLPPGLGSLAQAGAALRERVAETIPAGNRRRSFWYRFFFGDLREAFLAKDSCGYLSGVDRVIADQSLPPVGRVSFVSVSVADPELLTIKAQRKLQEADVIVHDASVDPAILEMARRDAVRLPVSGQPVSGTEDILIREARAGKLVVRLAKGTVALEETVAVAAEGVAFEAVPSVAATDFADETSFPTHHEFTAYLLKAAS